MASTVTHIPSVHCVLCLNADGTLIPATAEVDGYQVCVQHTPLLQQSPTLAAAIRSLKPQQGKGNPT